MTKENEELANNMEPEIIYEDKDILAINKPDGLVVHSDGKTVEKNLTDWLLSKYPEIKGVGEPGQDSNGNEIDRPGIVHRLDRETSGVMLVAKNHNSFLHLKNQFKNHEIQKIYQAFVYGEIKIEKGKIERPIGRSSKDFRMWSAQRGARGELREAITNYKVLNKNKKYSFVEVMPKTGRTHQIRVHFKAISHPLVADSLYANGKPNDLGFKRLALHSLSINFKDLTGKEQNVVAEYPLDFKEALNLLQRES
jgi:23S rRNA pseudouridine1911/1915/1917 synthase